MKLNYHRNDEGQYHCPITYKQFTDHSHIVAVRETGNVYSFDAYQQFNKQPQWYHDLLTSKRLLPIRLIDDKFDPKKVITLQDPKSPGRKTR